MIIFVVRGTPQPQGSLKAFIPKGWARPVLTSDNSKLKAWRSDVKRAAREAMLGPKKKLIAKPKAVRVEVQFCFAKPASVKSSHKTTRPDLDKLCRGLLDALTGTIFEDDSQVTMLWARKFFGPDSLAQIKVTEIRW